MSDVKRKAMLDLGEIHRQVCYESGDHPDEIDTAYSIGADAIAQVTRLTEQLATARRDALEEAARIVDTRKSILEVGTELSSRIRALIDKDATP